MPNTKITKDRLKNHWQYSRAVYIFGTLAAVLLAALLYTVVTNREPPNQFSVNIALVRSYSNTENLQADRQELLKRGQAYDETLRSVSFMGVGYEGDSTTQDGYYGAQLYTVQLYAGDNDIFIQNKQLTQGLIDQGGCLPLEEMDEFISFMEKYPDAPLFYGNEPTGQTDEEGNPVPGPEHVYAIDISGLTGFIERQALDNREMYACILANSANPGTSMYVLGEMYELFQPSPAEEAQAQPEAAQ